MNPVKCDACGMFFRGVSCISCGCTNGKREECECQTLREKYEDAKGMIDGVYELIEIYWEVDNMPYNIKYKKEWLRKAREIHGACPMP